MATALLQSPVQEKVIDYLQDAHALEQNVLRMLDSMLATTNDPEVLRQLKRHRMDTERHERMVRERLEALGASPSITAEVPAVLSAWMKGLADQLRTDKPGKNARDGYITEHVEIAAYSLLEQLALHAGDLETARVARFIREDEEEMARWIAGHWRHFVELTLHEAGMESRPNPSEGSQAFTQHHVGSIVPPLIALAGLGLLGCLVVQLSKS